MTNVIDDIHHFWFGELDERGRCVEDRNSRWFGSDEVTDSRCRERFGAALSRALDGQPGNWADTDQGLVALVVLLDQFSRNIYRGTAQAFAGDERALALALKAIECGRHLQLPAIHRVFLYLPLEHCEDIAIQEHCVELFRVLEEEMNEAQFTGFSRYAVAHRDVIARFGRFPHRNVALGRESSEGELIWMETHKGF